MSTTIKTFSFVGIDVVEVNVEVKISAGLPNMTIVGLADKAVAESKERVRLAISSLDLMWPQKRITVNLAPADLQKVGSHFDLAIALGILVEMQIIKQNSVNNFFALGELSLSGDISAVSGIISASIGANQRNCGIICPEKNGSEAAWAGSLEIIAAPNLSSLIRHLNKEELLERPKTKALEINDFYPDFLEIKGQESAKRALEIAAAGGHNLLMSGPPGTGKSMLASRLVGILPPPDLEEILEINMIHSIAGNIIDGKLITRRPYRDPHHSCSMPAMVGGGNKCKPGEISLACHGILFLDELPEYSRQVLESLRQPLETKQVSISRANSHITYPANFQFIAAMNPCRCGYLGDEKKQCKRITSCGQEYQNKISGPLLDRIDIIIEIPQIDVFFSNNKESENSKTIKERVVKTREIQKIRYQKENTNYKTNSQIDGKILEKYTILDEESKRILKKSVEKMSTSMRGITRILRVARTIADLENSYEIKQIHLLEAIGYRRSI